MINIFSFFATAGTYIIWAFIIFGLFALAFFCKKILNKLSTNNSSTVKKALCVILCVLIGVVGVFSVICSMAIPSPSDKIYVIYYDNDIAAGDTMHITFKGKPDNAYDIEFEGITCNSKVEKSDAAGYVTYTCKTSKNSHIGEDHFYIFDYNDSDISTDYYYFTVK